MGYSLNSIDIRIRIRVTGKQIERVVKARAKADGITNSPHHMRASFITLAFEGGADLALVQDAARHKDPRTTRRYQNKRISLHKNAADFVWI